MGLLRKVCAVCFSAYVGVICWGLEIIMNKYNDDDDDDDGDFDF